jgi:phage-related protein
MVKISKIRSNHNF